MGLERLVKKIGSYGKKILIGTSIISSLYFAGCKNATKPKENILRIPTTADAEITNWFPEDNIGELPSIRIANYRDILGNTISNSFLFFPLPNNFRELHIKSAKIILTRVLDGYRNEVSRFYENDKIIIDAHQVNGLWDEITLDWDNQPPIQYTENRAGEHIKNNNDWFVYINVSQIVKNWQYNAINYGISLSTNLGDGQYDARELDLFLFGRDSTATPTLEITYEE